VEGDRQKGPRGASIGPELALALVDGRPRGLNLDQSLGARTTGGSSQVKTLRAADLSMSNGGGWSPLGTLDSDPRPAGYYPYGERWEVEAGEGGRRIGG